MTLEKGESKMNRFLGRNTAGASWNSSFWEAGIWGQMWGWCRIWWPWEEEVSTPQSVADEKDRTLWKKYLKGATDKESFLTRIWPQHINISNIKAYTPCNGDNEEIIDRSRTGVYRFIDIMKLILCLSSLRKHENVSSMSHRFLFHKVETMTFLRL